MTYITDILDQFFSDSKLAHNLDIEHGIFNNHMFGLISSRFHKFSQIFRRVCCQVERVDNLSLMLGEFSMKSIKHTVWPGRGFNTFSVQDWQKLVDVDRGSGGSIHPWCFGIFLVRRNMFFGSRN